MRILSVVLLNVVIISSCHHAKTAPENIQQPNFIYFITDDISFNDLGCYGNTAAITPHIDRMAANGLIFTNAYLTASSCSPSRSSIITGRYPHNTGAPELHSKMPDNQVLFPELMKRAGYYTILSGKNHMGPVTRRAFDSIDGGKGPGAERNWISHMRSRPADKPFFFWFASYDAHRDWQFDSTAPVFKPGEVRVPPMLFNGMETRKDLAGYYHEVSRTDYYLGLILDELDRQGIAENTYVIYMSDNGRPFPRAKTRCYDNGMKTPLIIYRKDHIQPGSTSSLVSAVDIAPTILELAGMESVPHFQGVSFVNILDDPSETVRNVAFAEHNWHVFSAHERMVRSGEYLYIRNAFPDKRNMCQESAPVYPAGIELWAAYEDGLTTPRQQDIFMVPRPVEELYLPGNDPYQFNNLADDPDHGQALARCRKLLDQWILATGDNVPEDPTPDREDIYSNKVPGFQVREMPGEKFRADTITAKGPVMAGFLD